MIAPRLRVVNVSERPYLHLIYENGTKERVPESKFFKGPLNRSVMHLRSKGEEVVGYTEIKGRLKIYLK